MNEYGGITMEEALEGVERLSKLMKQCYDEKEIIFNIKCNPNLNWFQKRRLIKNIK